MVLVGRTPTHIILWIYPHISVSCYPRLSSEAPLPSRTKDHISDKMRLLGTLTAPAILAHTSLAALYYPTPQASFLEHILVDNWGAYASNFSSAITPCSNYVTEVGEPAVNSGRTTAAQWMRVAFHDFVTADVEAGTGGVDASIGFETARGENSGSAFNDSFTFWAPFVNDAVSSELVSCSAGEGEALRCRRY